MFVLIDQYNIQQKAIDPKQIYDLHKVYMSYIFNFRRYVKWIIDLLLFRHCNMCKKFDLIQISSFKQYSFIRIEKL